MDTRDDKPARCGYSHGFQGWWCSRDDGHAGPCALHPDLGLSGEVGAPEKERLAGGCLWGALIAATVAAIAVFAVWYLIHRAF